MESPSAADRDDRSQQSHEPGRRLESTRFNLGRQAFGQSRELGTIAGKAEYEIPYEDEMTLAADLSAMRSSAASGATPSL